MCGLEARANEPRVRVRRHNARVQNYSKGSHNVKNSRGKQVFGAAERLPAQCSRLLFAIFVEPNTVAHAHKLRNLWLTTHSPYTYAAGYLATSAAKKCCCSRLRNVARRPVAPVHDIRSHKLWKHAYVIAFNCVTSCTQRLHQKRLK